MGQPTSEWVSLGEAAQIIGVHPATIRNWAEQGELPYRRTPGGHRRFRRSDLQQWIATRRMAQPNEAQVIVQSALGRARLEMADRQHLMALEWYGRLNLSARETMRIQGLRLMDSLVLHLANSKSGSGLRAAHEIGQTYGALLKNQGLTLSQALQGYYYFVDFLFEALIQLSDTGVSQMTNTWGETLRQVNAFIRETLTGMVEAYEQNMVAP